MPKGDVWYELPGGPAVAGKMPPPPCASRAFSILGPAGGSGAFLTFHGFSLGGGLLPTGEAP